MNLDNLEIVKLTISILSIVATSIFSLVPISKLKNQKKRLNSKKNNTKKKNYMIRKLYEYKKGRI